MPRSGIKGNKGNCTPKIRSSDMGILLATQKELTLNNPDSPAVNKKTLKQIAEDGDRREQLKKISQRYASLVVKELDSYDKGALKNETAVDLDDYKAVMERTRDYFYGCAEAEVPATVNSYCVIALGLSLQRVGAYLRTHHNESTEFISKVKDMIADQTVTASLIRSVDNVTAIFQLKNMHGYADNVRIEAAVADTTPEIDEEALKAEYMKYAADNGIDITPESEDK